MKTISKGQTTTRAFTLTELVVVIAILVVMASLVFPAMAKTKNNGHAAQCQSNLRRLTAAWTMYTSDNADRLVANASPVAGDMTWGSSQSTNFGIMIDSSVSLLAPYIKDATLYKCPADSYQGIFGPRCRSVSMSAALGANPTLANQIAGRTYFKTARTYDLTTPGPASIFVMLDEHPDSINDSTFHVQLGLLPANAQYRDHPGSFHNGAGSISFADGHCELKLWRDTRTLRPVTFTSLPSDAVPNSEDYAWLDDRSPYKN